MLFLVATSPHLLGAAHAPGPAGRLVGNFFEENKWKSKRHAASPLGLCVAGDSLGPFQPEAQGGPPEGARISLWEMHLLEVPTSPPAMSLSLVLRSFQPWTPSCRCSAPVGAPGPAREPGSRVGSEPEKQATLGPTNAHDLGASPAPGPPSTAFRKKPFAQLSGCLITRCHKQPIDDVTSPHYAGPWPSHEPRS